MSQPPSQSPMPPLSERLIAQAEALSPDRPVPLVFRIVELRRVLSQLKLSGFSWGMLARLLAEEGLHISPGTLRNYMRLIGLAEARLHGLGQIAPSDAEIHAALRLVRAAPAARRPPSCPPSVLSPPPAPPPLGLLHARGALNRNPDRDL